MSACRNGTSVTLASLAENWLSLAYGYRPSAFWFWNSDMDRKRMCEVVKEMAANGIREFLIHPVHGMEVEYLSEEFFDCYRYALSLAAENNLKVWVYDEYGWPSGSAGGLMLREHPEHLGWYLHFDKDEQGNVVAGPRQSDRVLDNTMGAPWTKSEAGYPDTLSTDAVRCFIDMTYERIRRECGKLFEDTVVGFFTDEPVCMLDARNGKAGGWGAVGMPWTPALPAEFRKQFGYDIESRYSELAGNGPSKVKQDYWCLVKRMYAKAYHGQIGKWCREHGLKYTGHVGEDVPLMQVRFSGSVYQCLEHMDEPGIDFLGCGLDPEHRFVDHVLIPSIARHAGRDRVYCEAFGISSYDVRLGGMLERGQMFGIYGINDISLMGFQQSLDGVRKRTYWPPLFMESPWWPFYPEFRDAFARSIGLTSLGVRCSRYAVMYPQNQLEQTDLFDANIWESKDPAAQVIRTLGLVVYEAGESFEFVFPEIIDQANVKDGKIVFPHAEYDAILAASDIAYFDDTAKELDRIVSAGGHVLRETLNEVVENVRKTPPSWADRITITGGFSPGDIRVFRFRYPDGELFAIRNVSDVSHCLNISSHLTISEWDPVQGRISHYDRATDREMLAKGTLYVTLSEVGLGSPGIERKVKTLPVDACWSVETERPNMARLTHMQFSTGESGWVDAVDTSVFGDAAGRSPIGIPHKFRGSTRLMMKCCFECSDIPVELGILFESSHLESLQVNGVDIDLSSASPLPVWDKSCQVVDIRDVSQVGTNEVSAVIKYHQFETMIDNDAFFSGWCMPTCDVFLAGSFRLIGGIIVPEKEKTLSLPLNLTSEGWAEYDGILKISCHMQVDETTARQITGIEVDLIAQDSVELILDGHSVGKRIIRPYKFELARLESGRHNITLRISSTSANVLATPSNWGVNAVNWHIKD